MRERGEISNMNFEGGKGGVKSGENGKLKGGVRRMDGEVWAQTRRKIGRSFYHMRYFVLESELLAYHQKKLQDNVMATARWRIADARLIVGIHCSIKSQFEKIIIGTQILRTKRMCNVARSSGCAARVASERVHFSIVFNLQLKNLCQDQRFVDGDDDFRNSILKLIPSVPKGSWIVRRSALSAACLLGKSVDCNYLRGHSYLEIDVDISSSTVAKCILGLVIGVIITLVVDMTSCTGPFILT